ncbi:MAG: sigma-54 dependent transcriptional regulator [Desulfotignum sp.]|nr:sigma-54 dependent transcriptional regulator [Desulfotignum sp.]MCF8139059.1 sigma-54 dependent transcriptional regulator [Desulfotignum sp.]
MSLTILVVDDEKDMLALLSRYITEDTDYQVQTENDSMEALAVFKQKRFDLVIMDLKMPKMGGLDLLRQIKKIRPDTSAIIMTAYATIETAVEAIQEGAYDYITKPFRRERILLTIDKALQWRRMIFENMALREELVQTDATRTLIGSSNAIKSVIQEIKQVAPTTATVLITGPSGTGKELAARALHHSSLRKSNAMVTVNCTAISENVIESELFGHVKGAFTGAWKDKKGLVEEADGSTLFLDEIGDLGLSMQTKLLRLLQEGEYKPVGSTRTRRADIRFVAATNHDLETDIKNGTFREDLFYRLNVICLHMPGLDRRSEDIPLLAQHFMKKYTLLYQKDITQISESALKHLKAYAFSGNVRELENMIERGVIFCRTPALEPADIFPGAGVPADIPSSEMSRDILEMPFREAKEAALSLFYNQYIKHALTHSRGNISRAAEKAGIQRQYLHRLIKEVGLDAEGFKLSL